MAMTLADLIRNPDPNWSKETLDALKARAEQLNGTLRVFDNNQMFANGQNVSDLHPNVGYRQPMMPDGMPENYIQRGNNPPIPIQPSPRSMGPALDYSSGPVDFGGMKGYRVKGDPMTVIMADGRIVRMGADTGADRKRMAEDLQMQMTRQKLSEGDIDLQTKKAQLAELMGFDPRSMGGAVSSKPRDLKLKPGEVWNPQTQQVESVEGSDIYNKQRGAFAQDKDTLDAVKLKTNSAKAKIEEILGTKKDPITGEVTQDDTGFQRNFGGYNAYLSQYFPGAGSDTRKNIESLKSDLKMAGLELIRSGGSVGQMTQQEWPIVEGMIASISPTLSEPEAKYQLGKVMAYMDNIAKKAETKFQNEWEGSQFFRTKPQTSGKRVTVTNDAEYNALPKGAIYITPTGETRTKR